MLDRTVGEGKRLCFARCRLRSHSAAGFVTRPRAHHRGMLLHAAPAQSDDGELQRLHLSGGNVMSIGLHHRISFGSIWNGCSRTGARPSRTWNVPPASGMSTRYRSGNSSMWFCLGSRNRLAVEACLTLIPDFGRGLHDEAVSCRTRWSIQLRSQTLGRLV
jgi:hypothetical protein